MKWWIGCSGFYYTEWRGILYPDKLPKNKWFEFYCKEFNTVELNVTFYRFPQLAHLKNWFEQSPSDFKFSAKVPRTITHYKRFKNVGNELNEFYAIMLEGLQEKLGPILFQLHPSFYYTSSNLELILSLLNNSFLNVIEFRHQSWWNVEVIKTMEGAQASFCSISHPELSDEIIATSPVIYYRFHGRPALYQSMYSQHQLEAVAEEVRQREEINECYAYFNNTMIGNAVRNAIAFKKLSGGSR